MTDVMLYKQIIGELETINNSPLSDEYYRCLSNLIIKRLLNLVSKKQYNHCKDAETKRIYDKYHKEYSELVKKGKDNLKKIMESK